MRPSTAKGTAAPARGGRCPLFLVMDQESCMGPARRDGGARGPLSRGFGAEWPRVCCIRDSRERAGGTGRGRPAGIGPWGRLPEFGRSQCAGPGAPPPGSAPCGGRACPPLQRRVARSCIYRKVYADSCISFQSAHFKALEMQRYLEIPRMQWPSAAPQHENPSWRPATTRSMAVRDVCIRGISRYLFFFEAPRGVFIESIQKIAYL